MTGNSISLSRCWRQRGSRYAIRAGRNLPDKEFRYLRTVIVTAAVYLGFNSELSPLLLTFRHRAGVRPYTSSYDFAEPCVFNKQSSSPILCPLPMVAQRQGLFLPKLQRQFAEFLQRSSLKRLRIFNVSTCVGFGYGLLWSYFLEPLRCLCNPISKDNLRHSSLPQGYGILTVFPSATLFSLALGADSP